LVNAFSRNTIAGRKILGFLIDAGLDPNVTNNDGYSPLHLAVKKGSLDMVEALLSTKPSGRINYKLDINIQGGP
jgi:ankyrin repeat protein